MLGHFVVCRALPRQDSATQRNVPIRARSTSVRLCTWWQNFHVNLPSRHYFILLTHWPFPAEAG